MCAKLLKSRSIIILGLSVIISSSASARLSIHRANIIADAAMNAGIKGKYDDNGSQIYFYQFDYYWSNPRGSGVVGYRLVDKQTGVVWDAVSCSLEMNKKAERLRRSFGLKKLNIRTARRPWDCDP